MRKTSIQIGIRRRWSRVSSFKSLLSRQSIRICHYLTSYRRLRQVIGVRLTTVSVHNYSEVLALRKRLDCAKRWVSLLLDLLIAHLLTYSKLLFMNVCNNFYLLIIWLRTPQIINHQSHSEFAFSNFTNEHTSTQTHWRSQPDGSFDLALAPRHTTYQILPCVQHLSSLLLLK